MKRPGLVVLAFSFNGVSRRSVDGVGARSIDSLGTRPTPNVRLERHERLSL
jgi:hypothetical protein